MIINSEELENGSLIESEVVIIGGGIAGITLARQLGQFGHKVVILESGGEEPDYKVQSLYSGIATMDAPGIKPKNIDGYLLSSRLRYYGGSGNHWDGLCVPLDPVDFAKRDWIPYSGWPFDMSYLKPYYNSACDLLEIPRLGNDLKLPHEAGEPSFLNGKIPGLITRPHYFTSFSGYEKNGKFKNLKKQTSNHKNIKIYLYASVTNIVLVIGGQQVKELEITCLNGHKHRARGKVVILATGGIENARILLASNDFMKPGYSMQSDWIGRCFQGHASISDKNKASILYTYPKNNKVSLTDDENIYKSYKIWYILATSAEAQIKDKASNFSVYHANQINDNAKNVVEGLALKLCQPDFKKITSKHIQVHFPIEHTPNRESRITLMTDNRDELGMPRVKLEWKNSELDFECFDRSINSLVKELGVNNAGRVQWASKKNTRHKTAEYLNFDRSHHIGSTRMSIDPKYGVVDEHSRMHGVSNLFVAGSSVFPTSGIANPTLTIVALTFRLAEHIHNELVV